MEIDWTQVLIAVIVVALPSILRELRSFYDAWQMSNPNVSYGLQQAAEFGVKAAEVMKRNGVWTEEKGKRAEEHAVNVAQSYLDRQGVKVNLGLIVSAVRAAWLEFDQGQAAADRYSQILPG